MIHEISVGKNSRIRVADPTMHITGRTFHLTIILTFFA